MRLQKNNIREKSSILENTSFRYLRGDQIANPHCELVGFFGCQVDVECFRHDILSLVKSACSKNNFGNKANYYLSHQQLITLIELAFVINNNTDDFCLNEHHPLYRIHKGPFIWHAENAQASTFPSLNLRGLSGREVNDISIFLDEFFSYMDLEEWVEISDSILLCANKKTTLDKLYHAKTYTVLIIKEYMEKLIEAMFLIFNIKSIPYVKLNHPAQFDFSEYEKTVGAENPIK